MSKVMGMMDKGNNDWSDWTNRLGSQWALSSKTQR